MSQCCCLLALVQVGFLLPLSVYLSIEIGLASASFFSAVNFSLWFIQVGSKMENSCDRLRGLRMCRLCFLDLARRMMQAVLPSLSSHSSWEVVRALTVGGCMVWEAMQASHPRVLILEGHHQELSLELTGAVDKWKSSRWKDQWIPISEPGFIFMLTARSTLCVFPDGVTFLSLYFFVSACFIVSLNIQTLRSYINLIVFFAGVCDFFGFVKESGSPGLVCHDLV